MAAPETEAEDEPEDPPWYTTHRGIAVVVVYGLLTLAALVLSTGPTWLDKEFLEINTSVMNGPSTRIPEAVYLYGFLGAMAYAFTSILAKFERGVTGVIRVGLRALAALPLAAGVFLFAGTLNLPDGSASVVAGAAFLVGLYVNLTLKALGGLADRLYGNVPNRDSDGSESEEDRSDEAAAGGSGGPRTE